MARNQEFWDQYFGPPIDLGTLQETEEEKRRRLASEVAQQRSQEETQPWYKKAIGAVEEYFKPGPKVRARDIAREIFMGPFGFGGQTKKMAEEAQYTVQHPVQAAKKVATTLAPTTTHWIFSPIARSKDLQEAYKSGGTKGAAKEILRQLAGQGLSRAEIATYLIGAGEVKAGAKVLPLLGKEAGIGGGFGAVETASRGLEQKRMPSAKEWGESIIGSAAWFAALSQAGRFIGAYRKAGLPSPEEAITKTTIPKTMDITKVTVGTTERQIRPPVVPNRGWDITKPLPPEPKIIAGPEKQVIDEGTLNSFKNAIQRNNPEEMKIVKQNFDELSKTHELPKWNDLVKESKLNVFKVNLDQEILVKQQQYETRLNERQNADNIFGANIVDDIKRILKTKAFRSGQLDVASIKGFDDIAQTWRNATGNQNLTTNEVLDIIDNLPTKGELSKLKPPKISEGAYQLPATPQEAMATKEGAGALPPTPTEAIPPKPAGMPIETAIPQKPRQFPVTVAEAKRTAPELKPLIGEQYAPKRNIDLIERANKRIQDNLENAHTFALTDQSDEGVATAIQLSKLYQGQGNFEAAAELVNSKAKTLTEAGRTVQAASIYDSLSPDGIAQLAAKQIQKFNEENPSREILELAPHQMSLLRDKAAQVQNMPEGVDKMLAKRNLLNNIINLTPTTTANKFMHTIYEISNLPRSLKTIADVSASLRQGIQMFFGHPKQWWSSFGKQFKYLVSERAFAEQQFRTSQMKNADLMQQGKLAITELGSKITNREEAFRSTWAEKIPLWGKIVRASERAYTGFLNELRVGVFDDLITKAENVGLKPREDPRLVESLATYVNTATGRGNLWGLERSTTILSQGLFSPRLLASRLNTLNPVYYVKLHPFARKEALKSLFTFAGGVATILGLAKMAGAEVGVDPRSADFAKIKIGNTRYDLLGGYQQPIRVAAQLISGKVISSTTGKEMTLGEGYKPLTRKDVLMRFFEGKEAPLISFATELIQGQTFIGEKITWSQELNNLTVPMVINDTIDLFKEKGMEGILMSIPTFLGIGVQTYGGAPDVERRLKTGLRTKDIPQDVINELSRLQKTGNSPSIPQDIEEIAKVKDMKAQVPADKYKQFLNDLSSALPSAWQSTIMNIGYLGSDDKTKTNALNYAKDKKIEELMKKYGYKEPEKEKKAKQWYIENRGGGLGGGL